MDRETYIREEVHLQMRADELGARFGAYVLLYQALTTDGRIVCSERLILADVVDKMMPTLVEGFLEENRARITNEVRWEVNQAGTSSVESWFVESTPTSREGKVVDNG